jgi:hypothetical protein
VTLILIKLAWTGFIIEFIKPPRASVFALLTALIARAGAIGCI